MECITLARTRNASVLFGLVGLLVALGLMFGGCARTVREALGVPSKEEVDTRFAKESRDRQQGLDTVGAAVKGLHKMVEDNGAAITQVKSTAEDAMARAVGLRQDIDAQGLKVTANAGSIQMLQSWASGIDGRLTGVDKTLVKQTKKLISVEQMAGALGSIHRDRHAKSLVEEWVSQYGGTSSIVLTRFGVGKDNVEEALKNAPKAVQDKVAELKQLVADGKAEVLVAAGLQDAIPCAIEKCKDLALRRAKALAEFVGANGIETVAGEQPKSIVERGGELRMAALVWKEVTPSTTTP